MRACGCAVRGEPEHAWTEGADDERPGRWTPFGGERVEEGGHGRHRAFPLPLAAGLDEGRMADAEAEEEAVRVLVEDGSRPMAHGDRVVEVDRQDTHGDRNARRGLQQAAHHREHVLAHAARDPERPVPERLELGRHRGTVGSPELGAPHADPSELHHVLPPPTRAATLPGPAKRPRSGCADRRFVVSPAPSSSAGGAGRPRGWEPDRLPPPGSWCCDGATRWRAPAARRAGRPAGPGRWRPARRRRRPAPTMTASWPAGHDEAG